MVGSASENSLDDGVELFLCRSNGQILALADRCSHRGGPLHEGEVEDGRVTCPWHGSTFRLDTGQIVRGPATAPQPRYGARVRGDTIEVRRAER
jgi:nitrite reductase/ring-hydroxylating ferredoxin subunit